MHHRQAGEAGTRGPGGFTVTMTMKDRSGRELGSFETRFDEAATPRGQPDRKAVDAASARVAALDARILLASVDCVDSTLAMLEEDLGRDCGGDVATLVEAGIVERWRYDGVRHGCARLAGSTLHRLTALGAAVLERGGEIPTPQAADSEPRRTARRRTSRDLEAGRSESHSAFDARTLAVLAGGARNITALVDAFAAGEDGPATEAIRSRTTRHVRQLLRAGRISRTKTANPTGGGWSYVYAVTGAVEDAPEEERPEAAGEDIVATARPDDARPAASQDPPEATEAALRDAESQDAETRAAEPRDPASRDAEPQAAVALADASSDVGGDPVEEGSDDPTGPGERPTESERHAGTETVQAEAEDRQEAAATSSGDPEAATGLQGSEEVEVGTLAEVEAERAPAEVETAPEEPRSHASAPERKREAPRAPTIREIPSRPGAQAAAILESRGAQAPSATQRWNPEAVERPRAGRTDPSAPTPREADVVGVLKSRESSGEGPMTPGRDRRGDRRRRLALCAPRLRDRRHPRRSPPQGRRVGAPAAERRRQRTGRDRVPVARLRRGSSRRGRIDA